MTNATSPDPLARRRLADSIRDACIRVGFFYSKFIYFVCTCIYLHQRILVKNHGISPSLPESAIHASLPFFDLPEEEKMKYDIHKTDNFKGYNALLSENTDPEGRGDLNEGWNFGWEQLDGEEGRSGWKDYQGSMGGGNVWPEGGDEMKEFRRALLTY